MNNEPFDVQLRKNFGDYLKAMWDQLDDYLVTAFEWTGPAERDYHDALEYMEWAQDKIEKTAQTAAGRGMAEAIQIMCPGDYNSADEVIEFGVERYMQRAKGLDAPIPPGLAFTQAPASGVGATNPAVVVPAPAIAPAEVTPTGPALSIDVITGIKNAVAAGLSKEMLAATYDITVADIDAVMA